MKKGLLIFPIYTDIGKTDGIVVKNEGIHKAFLAHGVPVDALKFRTTGIYNGDEQVMAFSSNKYLRAYQLHIRSWGVMARYAAKKGYDFVWARLPLIQPFIASFVASVKTALPRCTFIIEYGAYPFENELTPRQLKMYRLNKGQEKKAHRFANYVITYCGQKDVDGVPNIPIDNGIDLKGIPVVQPNPDVSKRINFVCVSSLKKWHAYERFIAGLPAYIQSGKGPEIHFDVVGNGPEFEKVKGLTESLGVQQYVTFHNFKGGAELDAIYARNHVAIGTLGFHRIGITNSSSLKNREYFARGLPIVVSTPDKDMPPELPYVKYVPGNEEPLDIADIVAFAQRVYAEPGVNARIRAYADDHVSWNSKIAVVLDAIGAVPAT
ncbi:glycosyltransferase family protein [Flaviaesturariibacter terrae]